MESGKFGTIQFHKFLKFLYILYMYILEKYSNQLLVTMLYPVLHFINSKVTGQQNYIYLRTQCNILYRLASILIGVSQGGPKLHMMTPKYLTQSS